MASPVFVDGEHMLWVAVRAHQLDVGAPVPHSSYGGAENIWQEGLTIPPVKFYEKGIARQDVIDFYLANLRWRDRLHGDLDPSRKSGGALHRLHCFCLEFDGACEVQRRVPTDWIIEPVDVSGYGSFSLAS